MILEDLAFRLFALPPETITLLYVACFIGAAVLAAFVVKGESRMARVPYFLGVAALYTASSFIGFLWTAVQPLAELNMAFLVPLVMIVGGSAAGFFMVKISKARSRDIRGDAGLAYISFIPFGFLYLAFAGPRSDVMTGQRSHWGRIGSVSGVVAGLVLLAIGGMVSTTTKVMTSNPSLYSDPAFVAKVQKARLQNLGIEGFMQQEADAVELPIEAGGVTIDRVSVEGKILHYHGVFGKELGPHPSVDPSKVLKAVCANDAEVDMLIAAGGGFQYDYYRQDGSFYGAVLIDSETCAGTKSPWAVKPVAEVPSLAPADAEPTQSREELTDKIVKEAGLDGYSRSLAIFFPEDAKAFRDEIYNIATTSQTPDEALSRSLALGMQVRKKHAAGLRQAPDSEVKSVLEIQVRYLRALEDQPLVCNQFILAGPAGVTKELQDRVAMTDADLEALYRAMYLGETSTTSRALPTDQDWDKLADLMVQNGATSSDFDSITAGDVNNPQMCHATLLLMRSVTDANFDGAERIRASMAAEIMSG